jgi:hypothetical protein
VAARLLSISEIHDAAARSPAGHAMSETESWGPWSATMPDAERRRAVLVLRTLASIMVGRGHPLYMALLRADKARDDARGAQAVALLEAGIELERLPALTRRRLVASYAGIMVAPVVDGPRRGRPAGRYQRKAEPKGAAA